MEGHCHDFLFGSMWGWEKRMVKQEEMRWEGIISQAGRAVCIINSEGGADPTDVAEAPFMSTLFSA